MKYAVWFCLCLSGLACNGSKRPVGPAPEYEKPEVIPWDSGAPLDPFANIEGEAVTDDEPEPEQDAGLAGEAGADAAFDAASDAGRG